MYIAVIMVSIAGDLKINALFAAFITAKIMLTKIRNIIMIANIAQINKIKIPMYFKYAIAVSLNVRFMISNVMSGDKTSFTEKFFANLVTTYGIVNTRNNA